MNTNIPFEALEQVPSVPIWIASTTLKNGGRKDIREFLAKPADEGDVKRFVLKESFRELRDTHNFFIGKGCEIRDSSGRYECIEVTEVKPHKSILPMLVTKRIS